MISTNSGTHLGYTAFGDASSIASQGISSPILYRDKEWHDRLPCKTVDEQLDYIRRISNTSWMIKPHGTSGSLESNRALPANSKAFGDTGLNLLFLDHTWGSARPPLLNDNRFAFGHVLRRLQANGTGDVQKISSAPTTSFGAQVPQELTSGSPVAMLSAPGAFSHPHCDRHGQYTYIVMMEGKKLWVYWPAMTDEDWRDFGGKGPDWCGGRPEAVVLQTGDVLIMPPGTPHAVYTLETSHALAGAFYDEKNMLLSVETMIRELQANMITTNEDLSPELKYLLIVLDDYVKCSSEFPNRDLLQPKIEEALKILQPCGQSCEGYRRHKFCRCLKPRLNRHWLDLSRNEMLGKGTTSIA